MLSAKCQRHVRLPEGMFSSHRGERIVMAPNRNRTLCIIPILLLQYWGLEKNTVKQCSNLGEKCAEVCRSVKKCFGDMLRSVHKCGEVCKSVQKCADVLKTLFSSVFLQPPVRYRNTCGKDNQHQWPSSVSSVNLLTLMDKMYDCYILCMTTPPPILHYLFTKQIYSTVGPGFA